MKTYTTIVGMEIHVELQTKSKMFCSCKNDPFGALKPNMYTCPVCLGLPGALPVINKKAIEWTIKLGLALGCTIASFSKFDRKNYFYPDLPKGYQISQYDQPFCRNGCVATPLGDVRIHRVHLEEDTGKLQHTTLEGKKVTLIDFNRSGVPLVEIVTEPDIRSGEHAKLFLKKLHQIIRYLEISEANMEEGSMRLEPNISLTDKKVDTIINPKDLPNYKVEVKNINSFNFVKRAIEYEQKRHALILDTQTLPIQETRGWNEDKNETFSQRRKETADDYRYFPEPDLPPIRLTEEFIRNIKNSLPELPDAKISRFQKLYDLSQIDAEQLCESAAKADFFEKVIDLCSKEKIQAKKMANWIINKKIDFATVIPENLLQDFRNANQVSSVSEDEIVPIISEILKENPKAVSDYLAGKEQSLMFLLGQIIKRAGKKLDTQQVVFLLKKTIADR